MDTLAKPTLHGRLVTLRPLDAGDAEAMFAAVHDEEGARLTGTRRTFTREQIERWCDAAPTREGRVDLAIVAADDGRFLGEVVLNEIDPVDRHANFRIALAGPEHYGRGYGSEAARLMLAHGFDTLGLHRVELEVYAFNARAIRVYEKLGFRREGVRREVLHLDGRPHDAIVMGLLRREHEAARRAADAPAPPSP